MPGKPKASITRSFPSPAAPPVSEEKADLTGVKRVGVVRVVQVYPDGSADLQLESVQNAVNGKPIWDDSWFVFPDGNGVLKADALQSRCKCGREMVVVDTELTGYSLQCPTCVRRSEDDRIVGTLDRTRWTIRPGYAGPAKYESPNRVPLPSRTPSPIAAPRATIAQKVEYVLAQPQNRNHECHWPGCDKQVPPALWGCREHWYKLPKPLRDRIWKTYQPGQEKTMTPSREYVQVAREAQEWIAAHYGEARSA
jgi:hypothetical protein